jgi:hypothetical protein
MLFAIFAKSLGVPNRIVWKLVDSPFPEIYANVSHTQGTTKACFHTAMLFAILKLAGPITFIPGFTQTFLSDFVTMHFPTSHQ